jgi:hypothetical protein
MALHAGAVASKAGRHQGHEPCRAYREEPSLLERHLTRRQTSEPAQVFTALNTALMHDGAVIHVQGSAPRTRHVLFFDAAPGRASHPRVLIVASRCRRRRSSAIRNGGGEGISRTRSPRQGRRRGHAEPVPPPAGSAARFTSAPPFAGGTRTSFRSRSRPAATCRGSTSTWT